MDPHVPKTPGESILYIVGHFPVIVQTHLRFKCEISRDLENSNQILSFFFFIDPPLYLIIKLKLHLKKEILNNRLLYFGDEKRLRNNCCSLPVNENFNIFSLPDI